MKKYILKKYTIGFLIISLLNFISCSSLEVISNKDLDDGKAQIDFHKEIYITTKDNTRYHFLAGDYYISQDSVYGKGAIESLNPIAPFKGSLAINDIIGFEQINPDTGASIGFAVGIVVTGLLIAGLVIAAHSLQGLSFSK